MNLFIEFAEGGRFWVKIKIKCKINLVVKLKTYEEFKKDPRINWYLSRTVLSLTWY